MLVSARWTGRWGAQGLIATGNEGLVSCQVFLMPSPSLAPDRPRELLVLRSRGQILDVFDVFVYKNRVFKRVHELLESKQCLPS